MRFELPRACLVVVGSRKGPSASRVIRSSSDQVAECAAVSVLIVGGGIGGLFLGASLYRRGIPCEIVERQSEWTTTGAAITLFPNGMRALRELGLDEIVQSRGAPVGMVTALDRNGAVVREDPPEMWDGVGRMVTIHRRALQEILLEAAGDVPVRMGTTVQSINQSDTVVDVRLSDNSELQVDLLVGADGIRSQVRALCFEDTPPKYVGQMYWRTALHEPVIDQPTMMVDAGRFVALLPLGAGLTYLSVQLQTDVPIIGVPANDTELLRKTFADFGEPMTRALRALQTAEPVHFGPAEEIVRDKWQSGRVILIGDAAHACSPVLAQGGSLAMEDGVVLSELLGELADIDRALADFVRRREPRCRMVRERTVQRIAMLNSGADGVDIAENMRATYAQLAEPI